MNFEGSNWNHPSFVISVAARMVGLPAQSLRYYERTGLLEPSRSSGNIRLYSRLDIERILQIKTLINDMGVNVAGVEVALRLMSQLHRMEELVNNLRAELIKTRSTDFDKSLVVDQFYRVSRVETEE